MPTGGGWRLEWAAGTRISPTPTAKEVPPLIALPPAPSATAKGAAAAAAVTLGRDPPSWQPLVARQPPALGDGLHSSSVWASPERYRRRRGVPAGRHVQVTGPHGVASGKLLSRKHLRLEVRDDGVYAIDLQATNGSYHSRPSAGRQARRLGKAEQFGPLMAGDLLALGHPTLLQYRLVELPPQRPAQRRRPVAAEAAAEAAVPGREDHLFWGRQPTGLPTTAMVRKATGPPPAGAGRQWDSSTALHPMRVEATVEATAEAAVAAAHAAAMAEVAGDANAAGRAEAEVGVEAEQAELLMATELALRVSAAKAGRRAVAEAVAAATAQRRVHALAEDADDIAVNSPQSTAGRLRPAGAALQSDGAATRAGGTNDTANGGQLQQHATEKTLRERKGKAQRRVAILGGVLELQEALPGQAAAVEAGALRVQLSEAAAAVAGLRREHWDLLATPTTAVADESRWQHQLTLQAEFVKSPAIFDAAMPHTDSECSNKLIGKVWVFQLRGRLWAQSRQLHPSLQEGHGSDGWHPPLALSDQPCVPWQPFFQGGPAQGLHVEADAVRARAAALASGAFTGGLQALAVRYAGLRQRRQLSALLESRLALRDQAAGRADALAEEARMSKAAAVHWAAKQTSFARGADAIAARRSDSAALAENIRATAAASLATTAAATNARLRQPSVHSGPAPDPMDPVEDPFGESEPRAASLPAAAAVTAEAETEAEGLAQQLTDGRLQGGDGMGRLAVVSRLRQLGPAAGQHVGLLARLVPERGGDEHATVRRAAADSIGQLATEGWKGQQGLIEPHLGCLVAGLADRNASVQAAAVSALQVRRALTLFTVFTLFAVFTVFTLFILFTIVHLGAPANRPSHAGHCGRGRPGTKAPASRVRQP